MGVPSKVVRGGGRYLRPRQGRQRGWGRRVAPRGNKHKAALRS